MPAPNPCLWFERQAEEAANFYVSLFPNSRIVSKALGPDSSTQVLEFDLDGRRFTAFNGRSEVGFNDSVSFMIDCEDQAEVDRYWDALTAGGQPVQCGWLKDRYGVSWQVVPKALPRLLSDPDRAKAGRVGQAMMKMIKLDVAALEAAAKG
jgi:predicted 3-demethylubiquinone-9 3-methyltransferase (glyoxalase superfamily)